MCFKCDANLNVSLNVVLVSILTPASLRLALSSASTVVTAEKPTMNPPPTIYSQNKIFYLVWLFLPAIYIDAIFVPLKI